jgi:hypothetical protein
VAKMYWSPVVEGVRCPATWKIMISRPHSDIPFFSIHFLCLCFIPTLDTFYFFQSAEEISDVRIVFQ